MALAAALAADFYEEVAQSRVVWTCQDDRGIPVPTSATGRRAMPFWSSRERVEAVITSVTAYDGFIPVEIPWDDFAADWCPGLESDGLLAGLNWTPPDAVGVAIEPTRIVNNVGVWIDD